jgi:magnesium transporter
VGSQSAMIFVRGLSTGQIHNKRWLRFLLREVGIGAVLGITVGICSGVGTYLFYPDLAQGVWVAASVAISIITSMTGATLMGAFVPLFLNAVNVDPALGSGPFVTTINDMMGILIYFGVSTLFLGPYIQ